MADVESQLADIVLCAVDVVKRPNKLNDSKACGQGGMHSKLPKEVNDEDCYPSTNDLATVFGRRQDARL